MVNKRSDLIGQIQDATVKARADGLAKSIVEHNAILLRIAARQAAAWAALPWYVRLYRRAKRRVREALWRIEVAVDVLCKGNESSWLND